MDGKERLFSDLLDVFPPLKFLVGDRHHAKPFSATILPPGDNDAIVQSEDNCTTKVCPDQYC
jgi:hypothetical protein